RYESIGLDGAPALAGLGRAGAPVGAAFERSLCLVRWPRERQTRPRTNTDRTRLLLADAGDGRQWRKQRAATKPVVDFGRRLELDPGLAAAGAVAALSDEAGAGPDGAGGSTSLAALARYRRTLDAGQTASRWFIG